MKQKKEKKWWKHLLIIPIMLVIDLIALYFASNADAAIAAGKQGHPAPAFVLIVTIVFGALTIVLTLRALLLSLRTAFHRRKDQQSEDNEKQSEYSDRNKPAWRCFIPLIIQIPVSLIIVFVSGYFEISNFYNDPNHIGFAIPAVTFLLAAVCLLITIILAIFCTIGARRRRKNY